MTDASDQWAAEFDANRRLWDIRTRAHVQPGVYGVEDVLAGRVTLSSLEVEEVGSVAGKDLLHLQCHFGMGTISWARLGANATGVDFSPESVSAAEDLARRCGVPVEFVEANVYDLPRVLSRRFDIAITSYGVLWWLPNLGAWAQMIQAILRPGGVFYIAEIHPVAQTFEMDGDQIRVAHDYFEGGGAVSFETTATYADAELELDPAMEHGWQHSLGEVVSSLVAAGLRIEWLREHPFSCYRMLPSFEQGDDGRWYPPTGSPAMPLLFSLLARRPDASQ